MVVGHSSRVRGGRHEVHIRGSPEEGYRRLTLFRKGFYDNIHGECDSWELLAWNVGVCSHAERLTKMQREEPVAQLRCLGQEVATSCFAKRRVITVILLSLADGQREGERATGGARCLQNRHPLGGAATRHCDHVRTEGKQNV